MIIKEYTDSQRVIWNEFVKLSKNSHFFLYRDYIEYHSERFKDHSLMVYNNNEKLIALLPGNIDGNVYYTHQGLTFSGLIYKDNIKQKEVLDIFCEMKKYISSIGIDKVIYKAIPNIYSLIPAEEDLYALFVNGAKIFRRDVSSTIYLKARIKYSKGRKWTLKKARSNDISIKEVEDVHEFWEMLSRVLSSEHDVKPTHTVDEITYLKSKFSDNIKLFASYKDGAIISGCVLFINQKVVHTQYLFNNELGRELGALDLLIDELINKYLDESLYFDFGISTENQGTYLNEGLISQKEGFGGRAVVHDFYEWDVND